jgi:hypothetical protein
MPQETAPTPEDEVVETIEEDERIERLEEFRSAE